MFASSKHKIKGSARSQIGISEVKDGLLVLPGNHYRCVLATSSLNFELQSEAEQDVIIEAFQSFLNSLTASVQILIRVRELDLDRYLEDFREKCKSETEEIYKTQLNNYSDFISKLVSGNKILSRRFYLIIPNNNRSKVDFETVKEQLILEQEIIIKGLEKIGMTARHLTSLEILDLFYGFYRPEQAKIQPLAKEIMRQSYDHNFF